MLSIIENSAQRWHSAARIGQNECPDSQMVQAQAEREYAEQHLPAQVHREVWHN